jgi:precorrin-4 methylase
MSARTAAQREAAFWEAVTHAGRFFMGDADVHRAVVKLTATLDEAGIPYAIAPCVREVVASAAQRREGVSLSGSAI